MKVSIEKRSIFDEDSKVLLSELNGILIDITGDDGTINFSPKDVENDESAFLVAYLDETPVGCGAIRKISNDVAEIKRIYARKNNAGIGRKIVGALEDTARSIGYKKILLETRIQNKHAITFYEMLGYKHCEAYGKYIGKQNAYCFEKELANE